MSTDKKTLFTFYFKQYAQSINLTCQFMHFKSFIKLIDWPMQTILFVSEVPFARGLGRKFRADFAVLSHKILIEIDGGQFAYRGGRHASESDKIKSNYAAMLGYRVLRFTPQMLERDPHYHLQFVTQALEQSRRYRINDEHMQLLQTAQDLSSEIRNRWAIQEQSGYEGQ